MATYDEIFAEYYRLYRGQATVPASDDREYLLGIALANNAIRRWDRADGVLWEELFTTNLISSATNGADASFASASTSLTGPTDMRKPGPYIKLSDPNNASNFVKIPVIEPSDTYAKSNTAMYAWFIGTANTGVWTLYFNGTLDNYDGWDMDYVYYKTPTLFVDGQDETTEMSDPNFMIQTMLQSRFVNSRNGFAYNDAKSNAIDALRNMVVENNSGTAGRGWNLLETDQTPGFGQSSNTSFFRGA